MPISLNGNGQVTGVAAFDTPTLIVDESNNRVGIGTTSPENLLDIAGNITVRDSIDIRNTSAPSGDKWTKVANYSDGNFVIARHNDGGSYRSNILVGWNTDELSLFSGASGTERMRIDSDGRIIIRGTATNNAPARLELQSQGDANSFYHREVFRVAVTSAIEISRLTTTGANGFQAYFKVTATGHNGGIGNGINIKEFIWAGGTNAPVQLSTVTNGNVPNITFDNTINNVCIVRLASSNGTATFQGTMMIEWLYPADFSNNTGVVS